MGKKAGRMKAEDSGEIKMCEKCGSELIYEDCWKCGGDGTIGHDCGEDTCCCANPEDNIICDICDGEGGYLICPICAPTAN